MALSERSRAMWAILFCFFASGLSGLVYQVVWVRELVLVFGATTFAVSTVLTAFMGGLALGSYYFGRRAQSINRPLRLYGLLEVGIGIYGLAVPFIFTILPTIYHPLWQRIQLSFLAISIVRFVFAASVLIVPTALMGATLPILSSYYARDEHWIGLRVGTLYALNTFGAVVGAGASGFLLIPTLGMRVATAIAAALNLFLGLVAIVISRLHEHDPHPSLDPESWKSVSDQLNILPNQESSRAEEGLVRVNKEPAGFAAVSRRWLSGGFERVKQFSKGSASRDVVAAPESSYYPGLTVVLISFALSGFVALSLEVIWSRVLALIIGSSVYAFSIMLTTFLIGLALGAWVASRFVDRIRKPVLAFAALEVGIGVASLVGAYLFNDLPYFFVQAYRWLEGSTIGILLLARFLISSMIMIVPTLFLGALFPLVVRIITVRTRGGSTGQTVGNAYAANTVGAIVGSFASGFILVPWLGLLGSLKLCAALNFLVAAALFISKFNVPSVAARGKRAKTSKSGRRRVLGPAGAVASLGLVVGVVLIDPPWDADVMSSAVYRYAPSMSSLSRQELFDYLKRGQGETIFYKEGITATVVVQRQKGERVLKVNGKPEASTSGDMPTQILIGALPLLLRDQTDDVLLIGLGSGVTLGSIEQFPIKRVTCVELEPAVVEASRHFDDVNNRPLDDPRLRMVSNDGRNFLFTTDEKFDVIVSEPSNPWVAGVASLFTLEYFKRGAERLKEDGLFSQWLQIYEMSPEDVRTLIATFKAAFPHVYLFRGSEGDLMLTGSKREVAIDVATIRSHFANSKVAADLKRIDTTSEGDLLSRFYMGPEELRRFAQGALLNTDDNALIEFNAPRRVGTAEETIARNVKDLLLNSASPLPYLTGNSSLPSGNADLLLNAALGAIKREDFARAEQLVNYSLEIADTAQAHSVLGELRLVRGNEVEALDEWHLAMAMNPDHFQTQINLGKLYLTKQDFARATPYLDRAISIEPRSARAHHLRGLAYQGSGDNLNAALSYRKALPDGKYTRSIKTFYLNFGTSLIAVGLYEEAASMLEEYVKLVPDDHEGHYQLGAAYEILAERSLDDLLTLRAIEELKRALTIQPRHAMSHYYLSKAYRRLERYDEADTEFELYERLSP